jgi:hypothetical protein
MEKKRLHEGVTRSVVKDGVTKGQTKPPPAQTTKPSAPPPAPQKKQEK